MKSKNEKFSKKTQKNETQISKYEKFLKKTEKINSGQKLLFTRKKTSSHLFVFLNLELSRPPDQNCELY